MGRHIQKDGDSVGTLSVFANYTKLDLDILDFAKRYPKKVTLNVVAQLVRT